MKLVASRSDVQQLELLVGDTVEEIGTLTRGIADELAPFRVPLVVFPHHGGGAANVDKFVDQLVALFGPTYFLVSSARGRDHHPHVDVLAKLRSLPTVSLACTQLSEHCSKKIIEDDAHLQPVPAKGRSGQACCAGTMLFRIPALIGDISLEFAKHRKFVSSLVPDRYCN